MPGDVVADTAGDMRLAAACPAAPAADPANLVASSMTAGPRGIARSSPAVSIQQAVFEVRMPRLTGDGLV